MNSEPNDNVLEVEDLHLLPGFTSHIIVSGHHRQRTP
jgi:hypothetical protein